MIAMWSLMAGRRMNGMRRDELNRIACGLLAAEMCESRLMLLYNS